MKATFRLLVALYILQSSNAYGMDDKTSSSTINSNANPLNICCDVCDGIQMFALFLCYCVQDFSSYTLESLSPQSSSWGPPHSPQSEYLHVGTYNRSPSQLSFDIKKQLSFEIKQKNS